MRWVQRLRMAALMLFNRKSETERLNQELEFHLEQQISENIANGMEPERARSAACDCLEIQLFCGMKLERSGAGTGWTDSGAICAMADAHCCVPRVFGDGNFGHGTGSWRHYFIVYDCALSVAAAVALSRSR